MTGNEEKDLVFRLYVNGWALWLALMGTSLVYLPHDVMKGVAAGGFLVVGNLFMLKRAVSRALTAGNRVTPGSILPKFYLAFLITVLIIFVLVSQNLVHVLGLLLGLSVFILNVFMVVIHLTGRIVYKTFIKEAV